MSCSASRETQRHCLPYHEIVAAKLCEGIVIRPHLLGESAQGIYYLTSGKLKGSWNCLRIMMKKRKMKLMKRKSERTLNSCMRHGDDHVIE